MNTLRYCFFIVSAFFLAFFATSCEEEMKNFEMETAQELLVIDAECNAMNGAITVRITKTTSFLGNDQNAPVQGAAITVRYNSSTQLVPELSAGLYAAYAPFPEETSYELTVEVDGKTYVATSYMPRKVPFTEVKYEKVTQNPFFPMIQYGGDTTYNVTLSFLDPPNEENFYRLVILRNDTLPRRDELNITNDRYFTSDTVHYSPWQNFYENDILTFELRSFDRAAYQFYTTMQAAMETGGAFSVPDNPQSNFSGGALGHFTAFSGDRRVVHIKKIEK